MRAKSAVQRWTLRAALAAALSLLLAVGTLAAQPAAGKTFNGSRATTSAAVSARIAAISDRLSKRGYTVIALAANGKLT